MEQQDQNQDQVAPDNPADVTHDGDDAPESPESPEEPRPPSPRGPMNWLQDDEVLHLDGKLDYVSQSFVICDLSVACIFNLGKRSTPTTMCHHPSLPT